MSSFESRHFPTISQGRAISFDKLIVRYEAPLSSDNASPSFLLYLAGPSGEFREVIGDPPFTLAPLNEEEFCEKVLDLGMNKTLSAYWKIDSGDEPMALYKIVDVILVTNGGIEVNLGA